MAAKPVPLPPPRTSAAKIQRHKPVEVTALVASRPLWIGELNRVWRRSLPLRGLETCGLHVSPSPQVTHRAL